MPHDFVFDEKKKLEFESILDESIIEARGFNNIDTLKRCRILFRKKVPWGLRSYVASIMALKLLNMHEEVPIKKNTKTKKTAVIDSKKEDVTKEPRYRGEGIAIFVNAGRRQRFYARIIIKILLLSPKIKTEHIGDIRIMDNYTFITVDPAIEEEAINILSSQEIKGRPLVANRAKKREDSSDGLIENV